MPEEYEQPGKFALLSERMGNPHASESAWKTGNSPEYVRLVYNLLFSIEKPIDFVHSIPSSEAMSYFDWVKERGSTIPVFYGPDLKIDTSDDYKMSGYSIKDSPNGI